MCESGRKEFEGLHSMTELITAPESLDRDSPLWRFALWLWKQPGAEPLCLAMQADGWHISRVLGACWLAGCGQGYREKSAQPWQQWHSEVTAQLRGLRKRLDRQDEQLAAVRTAIARAELEAEQVELALLYRSITNPETTGTEPRSPDQTQVENNLRAVAPDHVTNKELTDLALRFHDWLSVRPTGERTE